MNQAILKRFLKAFVGGGVGAIGLLLAQGISVHSLADLQHLGQITLAAFISGGLLAIEKMLSWQDAPQQ